MKQSCAQGQDSLIQALSSHVPGTYCVLDSALGVGEDLEEKDKIAVSKFERQGNIYTVDS